MITGIVVGGHEQETQKKQTLTTGKPPGCNGRGGRDGGREGWREGGRAEGRAGRKVPLHAGTKINLEVALRIATPMATVAIVVDHRPSSPQLSMCCAAHHRHISYEQHRRKCIH